MRFASPAGTKRMYVLLKMKCIGPFNTECKKSLLFTQLTSPGNIYTNRGKSSRWRSTQIWLFFSNLQSTEWVDSIKGVLNIWSMPAFNHFQRNWFRKHWSKTLNKQKKTTHSQPAELLWLVWDVLWDNAPKQGITILCNVEPNTDYDQNHSIHKNPQNHPHPLHLLALLVHKLCKMGSFINSAVPHFCSLNKGGHMVALRAQKCCELRKTHAYTVEKHKQIEKTWLIWQHVHGNDHNTCK